MNESFGIDDLPQVFSHLSPVPQDDGPTAVCRIDYPPQFVVAYDYFRAVVKAEEYSPRSLQLTALCLQQNPANYTVWHFRRLCLYALPDWRDRIASELTFTAQLGGGNPKNYQIWYHRRALLEENSKQGGDLSNYAESELLYVASVLKMDGKNYHAWSHRQWVVQKLNVETVWEAEIRYVDELLQLDPRNNSAWNQRWFALHRARQDYKLSLDMARAEADYAIDKARLDPYNESPFRYLVALLKEQIKELSSSDTAKVTNLLVEYEEKLSGLKQVLAEADRDPEGCPNLLSALVDISEWKADTESLDKALVLLEALAEEHDPIRRKYWRLRRDQILLQQQAATPSPS